MSCFYFKIFKLFPFESIQSKLGDSNLLYDFNYYERIFQYCCLGVDFIPFYSIYDDTQIRYVLQSV